PPGYQEQTDTDRQDQSRSAFPHQDRARIAAPVHCRLSSSQILPGHPREIHSPSSASTWPVPSSGEKPKSSKTSSSGRSAQNRSRLDLWQLSNTTTLTCCSC